MADKLTPKRSLANDPGQDKKSVKRIKKDIDSINKNVSLRTQERIHCIFNENDIHDVKALIIGPKDTPYEGGYFFFTLRFSANYPYQPPTGKMLTLGPSVRFNPNLYECGKICVSTLNTWGKTWTICMSMTTVLCSIQSLMSDKPYINEPGHEGASKDEIDLYNNCVEYYKYKIAIVEMLKKPVPGYEGFLPIMEKEFVKFYPRYKELLKKLEKKHQGKSYTAPSPFTNMSAKCNYKEIVTEVDALYKKLSAKYAPATSK